MGFKRKIFHKPSLNILDMENHKANMVSEATILHSKILKNLTSQH